MVTIQAYSPLWPEEFAEIAAKLRAGLGPLALRIDHIGSTSVPGLAAKDIIDLQITVAALSPDIIEALQALGYQHFVEVRCDHRPPAAVGPDSDWQKLYFRPPPGQRPTHTHVRQMGRPNQIYPLLFRDYLRAHPPMAEAYARLKQRLAETLPNSQVYSEVKDPAVDLIFFAAQAWAERVDWKLEPGGLS
ncbi:hypothetical protein COW36_19970 [bacterium (Candidatus Blackallbacteria) CG17_big_fil_post_rev_8_21_14_2_50_48_46]|uniref:GrpB family protein n=1 Tax=bacterium (Candidatus Blackallbacteria) CG17_big_fil_post_rev_8_21_14_2_50_48_46 TaxID=2014261 RepID=A0A2M7G038_9BACT|nr:MAG: hypothetical protein COW64_15325 [bacterium (Candidatus Blackallbacteria) CG18_big_fil_WC_8_21_14_2_50_49_26]PIW14926.1 MAG: hypothetical protein COW36_19970 [bacterium (Candidatus Blackallbacteria) CG17_big_fil_post_rev_8_21_14_2_50_48_46]PIW44286.1 MAG: hypothetical protein COW20_24390 [bacterium (Candidatus Blackallbacteria) CG13_big_fil_rev_8_21_14_2_50_49_14]